MSTNNGIYILKTPIRGDLTHFEWRVAVCSYGEDFIFDPSYDSSSAGPIWNLPYILIHFSKVEVYTTEEAACQQALALCQNSTITMDRPFPTPEEANAQQSRR
jgi:hypothetical protein